ncbi:MAG TPA: dinitrogenase iron-molybdenum cofactor biosynthesis protein [Chloroflexi bacterium]|jgi:predicted Fe-Mo cluster-binding NifX family protein|nr:dinitrogenase iron-molybdenum cofactor biosynthesis protein [Chloroflexota bacterium]HPO58831.1 NifB/NifX family molybdenum-iron cluster-binding protein [Anaerolineaceae bacterium]
MKIAVITEDGRTISRNYTRAPYCLVLTVENGVITGRELREMPGRDPSAVPAADLGLDAASHSRQMAAARAIADCQALLCGGMVRGAYESLRWLGVRPLLTDRRDIDAAVRAYLAGELADRVERLN